MLIFSGKSFILRKLREDRIMDGKSTSRIAWIDIFKAICIILVVIGHSTGKFNHYIYQFHMAAFFFISGYTSKIWKKNAEEVTFP